VNSRLLQVNFGTSRPRNSFSILNAGIPPFCTAPSHCPMRPWAATTCFSRMTFRGFAFREFSLLLISNVPMPEIAKWPPLDQWLDPLQTDDQDHPFENYGLPSLNQEATFIYLYFHMTLGSDCEPSPQARCNFTFHEIVVCSMLKTLSHEIVISWIRCHASPSWTTQIISQVEIENCTVLLAYHSSKI
jgi:hypothetical protein